MFEVPHIINIVGISVIAILSILIVKGEEGVFGAIAFYAMITLAFFIGPVVLLVTNIIGFFITRNDDYAVWGTFSACVLIGFFCYTLYQRYSYIFEIPFRKKFVSMMSEVVQEDCSPYISGVTKSNSNSVLVFLNGPLPEEDLSLFISYLKETNYPFHVTIKDFNKTYVVYHAVKSPNPY